MSNDEDHLRPSSDQTTLDKALASPIAGLAPWIILTLISGPGRFEISVLAAWLISVIVLILNRRRGGSLKILELSDVVFFTGLAIVGAVANDDTITWLENWAGEVSNVALVVIVLGSIAAKVPFTIQYAREEATPEEQETPIFLHINYVLTWAWAAAFIVAAVAGFYGDAVLDNSNNLWTGWIIQTYAIVAAAQFTAWYPDYAVATSLQDAGLETDPPPPIESLLVPVAAWLVPIGVCSLVFDAAPTWVGVVFIICGAVPGAALRRRAAASGQGGGSST